MEADQGTTGDGLRHERVGRLVDEVLMFRAGGDAAGERALLAAHPDLAATILSHVALVDSLRGDQGGLDGLLSAGVLQPSNDTRFAGQLGAYQVRRLLGRGGMGVVLDAYEESLNRTVALKLLRPELAGEASSRRRFATEARAAAATEHPNVITVYAVGEHSCVPYLAMEYIPGGSLAEFLADVGQLPTEEARRIFAEALAGLAAAHGCGLLHRDIKPSNILLAGAERRVKLADFGLARLIATPATQTMTGSILGTPEYMSPEQARGDRDLDQRSDLYSMGVVLYEMLTGESPFRADTPAAVLHRILHEEPADLRRTQPGIDPLLASIAVRLLAKQRADRFASAPAVLDALSAGRSVVVPHRRRRVVRGTLATGTVALLVVAALLAGWQWLRPRPIVDVRVSKDGLRLLVLREGMPEPKPAEWLPKEVSAARMNAAALVPAPHGAAPTMVVGTDAPLDGAGSTLVAFRDDVPTWRVDFTSLGASRAWRDCHARQHQWKVLSLLTCPWSEAETRLLVAAGDNQDYPMAVVSVAPGTGATGDVFWHSGRFDDMLLADEYFPDGRPALVAWGVNNKLDGFNTPWPEDPPRHTKYDQVPVVMILDPARLDGSGPPYGLPGAEAPPAGLLAYAYLDMATNKSWRAADGTLHSDGVDPDDCANWGMARVEFVEQPADDDDGWRLRMPVGKLNPNSPRGYQRVVLWLDRGLAIRQPTRDITIDDAERHYRDPDDWVARWHVLVPER